MDFKAKFLRGDDDHLRHPAFFWLLIVLLMVGSAIAVSLLADERQLASITPSPLPSETREPRFYTVSYRSGVFSPTNLRIHAGDTVRFKNESFFGIRIVSDPHPAHNQLFGFDSVGDVPQGSYFSYTFSEKGIFGYHNEKKPEEQGMIIVR